MKWKVTDAYAHFGKPRFGSLTQLLRFMDVEGIAQSVAVLGPLVPDIWTLAEAASTCPERVRTIGIPFGETKEERLEAVQLQLNVGAVGIRFEYREALDNPEALKIVGEKGRWAYGIDACRDHRIADLYLNWLSAYPEAKLAAPHFMYADFSPQDQERTGGSIDELMKHPRFYGILVRNLGMCGSVFPHAAYKPWIAYALELCGPERLMWGSEYPVLFWRDENVEAALQLFRDLLGNTAEEQFSRIAGGNAADQFFAEPAPAAFLQASVPQWMTDKFQRDRSVTFFPKGLNLSRSEYSKLLDAYLRSQDFEQGSSLSEFLLKPWRGSKDFHK